MHECALQCASMRRCVMLVAFDLSDYRVHETLQIKIMDVKGDPFQCNKEHSMSTHDSQRQSEGTSGTQEGNPSSPFDDSCGECGSDVRWFTLAEFSEHIKDDHERRTETKAMIERTTREFGPALDLRFKVCQSCGAATAVSSMRLDPDTGRVVRQNSDFGTARP